MGEVIQIDPEYYRIKRALALYEDKDIVIFKELAEGGAFTANLYRLDPVVVLTREHLPLLEQEIRRRQEAKVKRSPVPFVFLSREDRRRIEEVGALADTELAMLKRFLDLWEAAITTLQGVVVTRDYLPFIEQEIELRKTTPKSIGGFWVLHSALLLENATPNLIAVSINECTSPAGVESVIKRVNDLLRKHKMEFPTPTVEEP